MTRALRALAVLIAVTGVIDPAIAVSRRQPVRVDFLGSSSASAIAVRDQLIVISVLTSRRIRARRLPLS